MEMKLMQNILIKQNKQYFDNWKFMLLLNHLEVNSLIAAIKRDTRSFNLKQLLQNISNEHIFRYPIQNLLNLANSYCLNEFVHGFYSYIILKLITSIKQNTWIVQLPNVVSLNSDISTQIKENYCFLLEEIQQKKSQTFQLILFVLLFSLEKSLQTLCGHTPLFQYIGPIIEKCTDIQSKACIWINEVITGVHIGPNVYRHLFKKYYQQDRKSDRQGHRRTKCSSNQNNLKNIDFSGDSHEEVDINQADEKNVIELGNQLKEIFYPTAEANKLRNNAKKKSEYLGDSEQIFVDNEMNARVKIFAQASMRNSNAFNEKRRDSHQITHFRESSNLSCRRNGVMAPWSKSEVKNRKSPAMYLVSETLRFIFVKNHKKNAQGSKKKSSLEDWTKKLHKMQEEGDIERVSLVSTDKRLRKSMLMGPEHEDDKNMYFRNFSKETLKNNSIMTIDIDKRKKPRTGFCEFIDNREAQQIGIVKSVINFSNTTIEQKKKKLSSKGFKNQFETFNSRKLEHAEYFYEQENFNYRLQKVITGTNKL